MRRIIVPALACLALLAACAAKEPPKLANTMETSRYGTIKVSPDFKPVWSWTGVEYGKSDVLGADPSLKLDKVGYVRREEPNYPLELLYIRLENLTSPGYHNNPSSQRHRITLGDQDFGLGIYKSEADDLRKIESGIVDMEADGSIALDGEYIFIAIRRMIDTMHSMEIYYIVDPRIIPEELRGEAKKEIDYLLGRFTAAVRVES